MTTRRPPLAYDRRGAAEAAGLAFEDLLRAVHSDALTEHRPRIDGHRIGKTVILRAELERWLDNPQDSTPAVAYSRRGAAEAVGLSYATMCKAVTAGDLVEIRPIIAGRHIVKGVILRAELERWLTR